MILVITPTSVKMPILRLLLSTVKATASLASCGTVKGFIPNPLNKTFLWGDKKIGFKFFRISLFAK